MFRHYDAQDGDGTSNVVAIYEGGGKQARVAANPADKAAELTAAVVALNAAQTGSPVQQYATAFLAQRKTLFQAFYTFHEGFRLAGASPSLTEYRAVLGDTLTILLTLPASFTTELAREQAGLQLPNVPVSGWTLVQCQSWHTLLSGWLGRVLAGVAGAMIGQLDG